METIYLSQSDFLPSERMKVEASESVLYRREGKVYKFLKPSYRNGRKEIINLIGDRPLVNTTKPIELIVDPYTEEFTAYSMEELIGYIDAKMYLAYNCLEHDYLTRRKAASDLILALRCLKSRGFEHHDLAKRNIMIGVGEGRIGDIDFMCNPSLGLRQNSIVPNPDEYMETKIMGYVGSIILKHNPANSFRNLSDTRIFGDKIVAALVESKNIYSLFDLYEDGYRAEDIYYHLDECVVEKYKSSLKV